jgi:hypothetical protein
MAQKRTVMYSTRKNGKRVKWYVVRDRKGRIVRWQKYSRCHAQDIKRSSKAERHAR